MRLPGAIWRPTHWNSGRPRIPRAAMILHTNGGWDAPGGSLFGFFDGNAAVGVESHVQIPWQAAPEQYADTDLIAWTAFEGSTFGVGVETQDDGNPSTPWTGSQVAHIVAFGRALGVPPRILAEGPSDGVGWHSLYGSWNRAAHNCVGPVREAQIHSLILPALAGHAPHPLPPVLGAPRWPGRYMGPGMSGPDVAMYQSRMIARGWHALVAAGGADGHFGPVTEEVTKQFQSEKGLAWDGIVGPATWDAAWLAPL